jgi:Fic family protein
MKNTRRGTYEERTVAGESVRAFIPAPLPPQPPLEWSLERQRLLERATLEVGRLDGLSVLLPDISLFLYVYVRKEAVLSSQIEGTQSSLDDLLRYESDAAPGVPLEDVAEVSRYVAALNHGLQRLREGFPLSSRLLREIHGVLMSGGRGSSKTPGEFRRSQNWLGGTRPGNAVFVPPPHEKVLDLMSDLEGFLHSDTPTLVKAALAHVQFETIHPFLDGNGRLGRLLITLLLCADGALAEPTLYLSLYFKHHRARYYELLTMVREEGDWEGWLDFFLEGIISTATEAVQTTKRVLELFERDRRGLETLGRSTATALRLFELLKRKPYVNTPLMMKALGLTAPTVSKAIKELEALGILHETTGKERDRIWVYKHYLELLETGEGETTPSFHPSARRK